MTQNQNTTSRTYQQLQPSERGEIMVLHNENWPASQIATKLHRDRSTITRELQRNTTRQIGANHKPYQAYYAETAQILHNDRRAACHAVSWTDKAPEFFDYLTSELHKNPRTQSVDTCRQAVQDAIDDYGPEHFKTLTFDNGSEFADLSKVQGTTVYFAHPYSPWERGTNENQNQLIRKFIPKGKSMKSLTLPVIQAIQDALNQRPRKILGYKSAMDILPDFD
ncbi:hypothetical protein C6Y11_10665 [Lactiplantibacillus pentosus]|nr:IS30 family transposase [Lactiplantibacillus pentosus]MCT3302416.1 IS30 family transposase [Lactiplantibacillus pentosus]PRO76659.1 hypothetical protein C6Y09_16555 [Lactiplantibacillus pentosus]PRO78564.1 hypothetical protein C6Y11_10665 [Lactiplantibacillus pentosus]PRO87774.1 hypothetical protein C6Y12_15030 [Lactiplantibacillus pentosus]